MAGSGLDASVLAEAVRSGASDVLDVARRLGSSAARLCVPLHEVLDHVERAYSPAPPDFAVVRTAAVAWAETALIRHADISCHDPLTSLATVPHLRSRLAETYRGAEDSDARAADVSALVVVEFPRSAAHGLELALRALDVADVLRLVFLGEETFVQLTPRRFAVLASHDRLGDAVMGLLALLLEEMLTGQGQARLWVEHLPTSEDGVAQILASLCE